MFVERELSSMGKHKNVLLITADQLRAECVHGNLVKTPNLDALAADGAVSFRKHYCNSTPCGPARASIHTGCYLMNHCVPDNGSPLNPNLTNWAKVAREHSGYDPVVVGYVSIFIVDSLFEGALKRRWMSWIYPVMLRSLKTLERGMGAAWKVCVD